MHHLIAPPLNQHYEGSYPVRETEWRRLGAIDKAENIQSSLGERTVATVLEVGVGTGAVLTELIRRGIGTSHRGVDVADPQDHLDSSAANLLLEKYDGHVLPFGDKTIDLVYASHVVEHVWEPRHFLSEMIRVARKYVYVEVPCELHFRTSITSLQTTLDIGHINGFSPESFQLLLESTGLDIAVFTVFDHSDSVYEFSSGSKLSAFAKASVRRLLLRILPSLAPKLFCYHVGALISV